MYSTRKFHNFMKLKCVQADPHRILDVPHQNKTVLNVHSVADERQPTYLLSKIGIDFYMIKSTRFGLVLCSIKDLQFVCKCRKQWYT